MIVFDAPAVAVSYVATAETVTVSPPTIPESIPAVTVAVVLPSYTFEVVRVGTATVNCFCARVIVVHVDEDTR